MRETGYPDKGGAAVAVHTRIVILIFAIGLFISESLYAEYVGMSKEEFEPHYRSQQMTQWCWAASVEMVLSTQGIRIPHGAIVEHVRGIRINSPGNTQEMAHVVNGVHQDEDGRPVIVGGQPVMGAPFREVLYNHLSNGLPAILTYQGGPGIGHAVVLFGIEAEVDPESSEPLNITRMYIADPFPVEQIFTPYGPELRYREELSYRTYRPTVVQVGPMHWQRGVAIEPGLISSITLVTGTVVPED